jgi:NitT/TauT family transport system substrate-binding protein
VTRLKCWFLTAPLLAAGILWLSTPGPAPALAVDEPPTFTLAWSEYPSWSVFGVAADKGLINGKEGKLGSIEKKWNVHIKLQLLDYEKCMDNYGAKTSDAVCITNMDVLNPSLARKSVVVLPTSTSAGADACIVVGIKDVEDLKKHKVYGLKESVSEYAFSRILEKKYGQKAGDFKFTQMDPDKAAQAMQAKTKGIDAIMVWNPFVLQTLKLRDDAKVLFDSSEIPEEIIDSVVIAQDVLDKPGGDRFAGAIIETYYEFNKMMADEKKRPDLLVRLGKKFSDLNEKEMAKACEQTRFYKTPEAALKLITGEEFPKTMKTITDFYVSHKILKDKAPKIGFGGKDKAPDADLRFDPTYIKMVQDKK